MKDILSYESDIWSCADLLISSGIKQSKFPDYMMPFFALIMLEGRMRNEMADIEASEGLTRENNLQEFIEAFRDRECGYNDYIVREGKTLSTICNNDKTFEQDFRSYLAGFDGTLKELLGMLPRSGFCRVRKARLREHAARRPRARSAGAAGALPVHLRAPGGDGVPGRLGLPRARHPH